MAAAQSMPPEETKQEANDQVAVYNYTGTYKAEVKINGTSHNLGGKNANDLNEILAAKSKAKDGITSIWIEYVD